MSHKNGSGKPVKEARVPSSHNGALDGSDKVPRDKWPVFAEGLESFSPVCAQRGPLSTVLQATNRAEQTLGVTSSSHLWGLGKAGPFVKMSDKRAAGSRPPPPPSQTLSWLLEKDRLGVGDRLEV